MLSFGWYISEAVIPDKPVPITGTAEHPGGWPWPTFPIYGAVRKCWEGILTYLICPIYMQMKEKYIMCSLIFHKFASGIHKLHSCFPFAIFAGVLNEDSENEFSIRSFHFVAWMILVSTLNLNITIQIYHHIGGSVCLLPSVVMWAMIDSLSLCLLNQVFQLSCVCFCLFLTF